MSFFSDLFEGNFSNLGTDITHAPESLAKHPSELYETLGGAAALATGGIGLGLLGGEAGAGALGSLGGFLGEGGAAGAGAGANALGAAAGTDALAFTGDAAAGTSTLGGGGLDAITGALGGGGGLSTTTAGGDALAAGADLSGVTPSIGDAVTGAGQYGLDAAPAGGGGGGSSFLGDLGKGAISSVTKNPLGIAAAGGLLGYDLLKGNPTDPNQKQLQDKANQLGAQGDVLRSYLTSGTLPPAMQAQLDQATKAEKARIVSGYAAKGMPTDPNQNSALAQELNNVDTNAVAAMASAQIQMMNTGLQETGLSTQLYETLVKLDQSQNDQLMKAISGFAAALGGGGGTTLKLA